MLKAHRVKAETLQSNLDHIRAKLATQRWASRVRATVYLRRRNAEALRRFREKTLRECYRQWHLRVQVCKDFLNRAFKFGRRI